MKDLFGKKTGFMSDRIFMASYGKHPEGLSVFGICKPHYQGWYLWPDDNCYEVPQYIWTKLIPAVVDKPDLKDRFLKHFLDFPEGGGLSIPTFKVGQELRDVTTYTSDFLLGVKISTHQLGANTAFKITDQKGDLHEVATKILEAQGEIFSHPVLEELGVQVRQCSFQGHEVHDGEIYYLYNPEKILEDLFQFVPDIQEAVNTEGLYTSFQTRENEGVKVGTVFGRDVFMRFVLCNEADNIKDIRRARSMPPKNNLMLISGDQQTCIEFIVHSTPLLNGDHADFDYYREVEHLQRCIEAIVLGIQLSLRNKDFRKGCLVK